MSEPFIVPTKSGTQHLEKLKRKFCAFPGCKVIEEMTGKGCYCKEHRNRKYRKIIDADKVTNKKATEEANNKDQNQIIEHDHNDSMIVVMNCQLEGCNKEFSFKIVPKVFVYPKFCPEHRNPFKRKMFADKMEGTNK